MSRRTTPPELTAEQQAEADRILSGMLQAAEGIRELAEVLASTDDSNPFGATEFAVRDLAHRIGAKAIQTALEGRKQGGTTGPAGPARGATSRPGSSGGEPSPS